MYRCSTVAASMILATCAGDSPAASPHKFVTTPIAAFEQPWAMSFLPEWTGSAFIAGLSSKAIIRVAIDGDTAAEAERFDMGERIRAVAEGPDGALWVLQGGGRRLKLTPADT